MGVRKIFIVLVTIVACVILGAFVLNILMPNVTVTLINSLEDLIYDATALDFDFNADGNSGSVDTTTYTGDNASTQANVNAGVDGFGAAGSTP